MMRSRHQDGWIKIRGKRRKMYYGYFRSADGREQSQVLGPKSEMTKGEAKEKLRAHIVKRTGNVASGLPDKNIAFERFVRDRWLPLKQGKWRKESTAVNNVQQIEDYAIAKFEGKALCQIDKVMLQAHLNHLAEKYSYSLVRSVRIFLMSIFEEAVDQDFITKDPAKKLELPNTKPVDKTTLEWDQIRAVFGALSERDRLIISIEGVSGIRPSEMFALRRKSLKDCHLEITETIYKGKLRKYGKTAGSTTTVNLPDELATEIQEWLDKQKNKSPDAFIFQDTRGGFIRADNFLHRVLYSLIDHEDDDGKHLGIPGIKKLNFQILRRSFSTLAQKHGTVKDVQRQMRHSRPDVTAGVYMQVIPESVKSMVSGMYAELMKKPASERLQ